MSRQFRAPAVPLTTVDPYFSVWSMSDELHGDFTRHWTGRRHSMTGLVVIDDTVWRFLGRVEPNPEHYYAEPPAMTQISVEIAPVSSVYTFEAAGIRLRVDFTTPQLAHNLSLLSRPASYVTFEVQSKDGRDHDVKIYFDVSAEWCVDSTNQAVVAQQMTDNGLRVMAIGHEQQDYLNRSGDDLRIDWGYFYLVVHDQPTAMTQIGPVTQRKEFAKSIAWEPYAGDFSFGPVNHDHPVMSCVLDFGLVGKLAASQFIVLAYDDIYSIEYFHVKLKALWTYQFSTTQDLLSAVVHEYDEVMRACRAFNRDLVSNAIQSGGQKYADLLSLAYRQAIAAHKLVLDENGAVLFLSKECFSNGCIATVDVSYPSIPLFLLYNPELVKGMMRPIFKYAASDVWPFNFAPHDVGQYPLANGQVYSGTRIEGQMPVEECGNMLVMMAAVCLVEGDVSFANENWSLISTWAEYLLNHGLDPDHQLCTDDFAGHLAHNANLSIKAIMGIVSYGLLCGMMGDKDKEQALLNTARQMTSTWEEMAREGEHYRLAFDQPGTWSLKYNLIWDVIFDTNVFDPRVRQKEVQWYFKMQNQYGIPLDNRRPYTKSDWLVWVASLSDNDEDFERLMDPLWDFVNESPDRVPFTDWYDTVTGRWIGFQHRSVVGGLFIKLLKDNWEKLTSHVD
ncbi:DUF4965 domain-containing protein [Alicyclobacillus fastidiosus]|uniref:DUF4965 domain-containing protein n=1 Tax=Alicyclobacillus fastidiosus TaxID=392011 RepID=A0ABY6ZEJ3_9BACL|nr:glutaminase family protein [Alicyclobacillus fastidiosus]WAH41310.1 DUF4965 domain-containing protein [Alicyclobacillus fastidiosus]GMA62913.1 hypothetical protein GCM10025859_33530 [Alicyclobacillus fastidiosus]